MKILLALLAAVVGAIIVGPITAILAEFILVPIFYGTIHESTAGWSALYIGGPAGMMFGFVGGGWMVLRSGNGRERQIQPTEIKAFMHE